MDRVRRASKSDEQDQYVLTVFLPLLAIAILACAGGCCYMEKRRKRRKKKNGGVDPEQTRQEEDFDDAASVISSSSARRRHYLMPTPTTGRLVRGASVRSNYSTFGEPLYDTYKRKANLDSSAKSEPHMDTVNQMRYKTRPGNDNGRRQQSTNRRQNEGYIDRPLTRSVSLSNLRTDDDDFGGLRRARSSTNIGGYRFSASDSGRRNHNMKSEVDNTYEYLNGRSGSTFEGRPPSPTHSEWSVRTAPPQSGYRDDGNNHSLTARPSSRPSSMVDFPLSEVARERGIHNRTSSNLVRSSSQPNLHGFGSRTYPYGILKKGAYPGEERYPASSNHTSNSSDSGIKEIYGDVNDSSGRMSRMRSEVPILAAMANSRPSTRPPSVMSYRSNMGRRLNYEPYYAAQHMDFSNGSHQNNYSEQVYAISGNGYRKPLHGGGEMYPHHYDRYDYNNPYSGHQTYHGHAYGAGLY